MISQLIDNASNINVFIAFLAGFITFFASCLLPLVPTYLAYLSGVSLSQKNKNYNRWQVLKTAFSFVSGFIGTFIILGVLLKKFAFILGLYRPIISQFAGLLFILLGMFMLGIFKHRLFAQERKLDFDSYFKNNQFLHAFLAGIAFGFGWTPCIGPILALILFWSASTDTMLKGITLLISFGIGLGTPFVLIALAFEKIMPWIKKYKKISKYINIIAGSIIIIAGLLMLSGNFQKIALTLSHIIRLPTK